MLNGSDSSGEDETKRITSIVSTSDSDSMEPQSKRPKVAGSGLSYVYHILEKKATKKKAVIQKVPEIQLDSYIQSTDRELYGDETDPILFWSQSSYTILGPFAIDVLSSPCLSTSVECTFSIAGIATSGRRNRLEKANLEKEVLLKKIKNIIWIKLA